MSTRARYDEVADYYQEHNPDSPDDPVVAALVHLAGPLRQRRVLDVACGGGRAARPLARCGAQVTGLDLSSAMLDKARAAEAAEPLGITYLLGDCTLPEVLRGEQFDAVVCHFGLTDIDDLDSCLATVARVLRPSGVFAFTILHPCFPGWGPSSASWPAGAGYYQEGYWLATGARSVLRQQVGSTHRMLSTYLNSLVRHGLTVEEAAEPGLPARMAAEQPDTGPVPIFLVLRCRRV